MENKESFYVSEKLFPGSVFTVFDKNDVPVAQLRVDRCCEVSLKIDVYEFTFKN